MAVANKPRFVDVSNPSLSVQCPNCGLRTQRFLQYCRNDGYQLWPSSQMASEAFKAWRDADPSRAELSRYDIDLPEPVPDDEVDYAERAHKLGIHLFPSSNYPFVICVGALFLGIAAVPIDGTVRLGPAIIGALIFLYGVVGWVLVEDVRMFPTDSPSASGEAHH